MSPIERKIAEALATVYGIDHGERNPDWDWEGPNDETNPYYLPRPIDDRLHDTPMVFFTAEDGGRSMRVADFTEIARVLAPVFEEGLGRWTADEVDDLNRRARAELAEIMQHVE